MCRRFTQRASRPVDFPASIGHVPPISQSVDEPQEIARRVNKNTGSVSPVIPALLEKGFIIDCKVGKVSVVYQLNHTNKKVQGLTLRKTLKKASR